MSNWTQPGLRLMRQLHPVSFHERFVASGTYTYYNGDTPAGDVERWTLHEPGAGSLTIRADYDGRTDSSIDWLFEGLAVETGGHWRIERFDLLALGHTVKTEAKFVFSPEGAEISPRVDGEPQAVIRVAATGPFEVASPALVARYWFLQNLPRQAGSVEIFEAGLDPASGVLHGGHISTASVEPLGQPVPVTTADAGESQGFRIGRPDGEAIRCWLNARWIPVYWESSSGQSARLTEYTHRPERSA
ncbi:MAG: hypothetical protein DIU68_011175 [Chloroflexota bacterium]